MCPDFSSASTLRTALLYMPWGSVRRPSLGLGILKECAARRDFACDVLYFNLEFASRIGIPLYERIATDSSLYCEWFFSQALFGSSGLAACSNGWEQLGQRPDGAEFLERVAQAAGGAGQARQIAAQVEPFLEHCLAARNWEEYQVVGFSTTFAQNLASLLLAKRLKDRYPEMTLVFGGANVDAGMGVEMLRSFPWLDAIVHGEAEHSFPAFLEYLSDRSNGVSRHMPGGISFRCGTEVHDGSQSNAATVAMAEVPVPNFDEYFQEAQRYRVESHTQITLPMESSRGCWWGAKHHCTFCGLNGASMSFRRKGAERTYEEILILARRYKQLHFSMADNILDMEFFHSFLPRMAEADTDISMFYEVKANLSKEQIAALRRAGVWSIQPGIESLNTEVLRLIQKGVTGLQNVQLLKWCEEYGIYPLWNILYGFPGEDSAHYAGQEDLIRNLYHLQPPSGTFPVVVERFSPYHFEAQRYGIALRASKDYRFIYPESVNYSEIAYFFEDRNGEERVTAAEEYTKEMRAAIAEWKQAKLQNDIQFYYERGPETIILYDNRPRGTEQNKTLRRTGLGPAQSFLYEKCDRIQSLTNLWTEVQTHFPATFTKESLEGLLKQFVAAGLMVSEGDRYLALAVRSSKAKRRYPDTAKTNPERMAIPIQESAPVPAIATLPVLQPV